MNDRVFIASLAGLLHDLWKVGAWAGADVASAQEAILKQIDGFCKADSDDLAEAVKETVAAIVASHGDADAEPTEAAPALRAIASAITLSCTEDSAGLPAPSRNDAAGDVYIQPRDLAAVEETELRSAMFPGAKPAQQDYQRLWDSLLQELGQLLGSWTRRSASAPGVTQDAWRHQLVHGLLGL
ncbi:MAG: hypothetical protein H5T86_12640, partial [Armatimonadetes bacterium]|nr:hypothetical protein [Armatimonadota bacterium]